mmetsp:Transcript_8934/g.19686  ORF Transcript_8934/g.19686 Transcript_8934/m.19686 type:complete len:235 (-) Transcript_8934:1502-2206(-)
MLCQVGDQVQVTTLLILWHPHLKQAAPFAFATYDFEQQIVHESRLERAQLFPSRRIENICKTGCQFTVCGSVRRKPHVFGTSPDPTNLPECCSQIWAQSQQVDDFIASVRKVLIELLEIQSMIITLEAVEVLQQVVRDIGLDCRRSLASCGSCLRSQLLLDVCDALDVLLQVLLALHALLHTLFQSLPLFPVREAFLQSLSGNPMLLLAQCELLFCKRQCSLHRLATPLQLKLL